MRLAEEVGAASPSTSRWASHEHQLDAPARRNGKRMVQAHEGDASRRSRSRNDNENASTSMVRRGGLLSSFSCPPSWLFLGICLALLPLFCTCGAARMQFERRVAVLKEARLSSTTPHRRRALHSVRGGPSLDASGTTSAMTLMRSKGARPISFLHATSLAAPAPRLALPLPDSTASTEDDVTPLQEGPHDGVRARNHGKVRNNPAPGIKSTDNYQHNGREDDNRLLGSFWTGSSQPDKRLEASLARNHSDGVEVSRRMMKSNSKLRKFGITGKLLASCLVSSLKFQAPAYRNFGKLLVKTGLDAVLGSILDAYDVTVLVPSNSAVPLSVAAKKGIRQRVLFHMISGAWDGKSLSSMPTGVKLMTFDLYPKVPSIPIYKLSSGGFGTQKSGNGASIFYNNMFYAGTRTLIAHGVTAFLSPPQYF